MTRAARMVIGGSLGGLIVAHLLRSTGWDAVVFERNDEELASRGVGLWHASAADCDAARAGIAFDETMGIQVPQGRLPRSRRQDARRAADDADHERLVAALPRAREALPVENYRLGKACPESSRTATGVTAYFADGTREHADFWSGRRRPLHGPRAIPAADRAVYAGYVAWRAVLDEARGAARHLARDVRPLRVLSAGRRATDQLSGAGARQRYRSRPARLQYRLVSADGSRGRWPICAPTPRAATTPPAFRRR